MTEEQGREIIALLRRIDTRLRTLGLRLSPAHFAEVDEPSLIDPNDPREALLQRFLKGPITIRELAASIGNKGNNLSATLSHYARETGRADLYHRATKRSRALGQDKRRLGGGASD